MPTTTHSIAITSGRPGRSRSNNQPSRLAHTTLVYCRKIVAAAVVVIRAEMNSTLIAAKLTTIGMRPSRQRILLGRTNGSSVNAANKALMPAIAGPRPSAGRSAKAGAFKTMPLKLHSTAAASTRKRDRQGVSEGMERRRMEKERSRMADGTSRIEDRKWRVEAERDLPSSLFDLPSSRLVLFIHSNSNRVLELELSFVERSSHDRTADPRVLRCEFSKT